MRKKLKGFTLVELIVVMAIFSALMIGVLSLLRPMSDLFSRTAQSESVAASLDNTKRYLESTLRYADRMKIYTGVLPVDAVDDFRTRYNLTLGTDTIYVMQIHNEIGPDNTAVEQSEGTVSILAYNGATMAFVPTDCAIDKNIFENYALQIKLGEYDRNDTMLMNRLDLDPDDSISNLHLAPNYNNLTFTIAAFKAERDLVTSTINYVPLDTHVTANFSCMNLMNPDNTVKKIDVYDYDPMGNIIGYLDPAANNKEAWTTMSEDSTTQNIWIIYTLPKKSVDY